MRYVLIALILATAVRAEEAPLPAAMPRMTPQAYAEMIARGEQERLSEVKSVQSDKSKGHISRDENRRLLAELAARKGTAPALENFKIGSVGRLAGCYRVLSIIGPGSTVIEDLNNGHRVLVVDGVDNSKFVDASVFRCEGAILEVVGPHTMEDGETLLRLQAVLPPAP